MGNGYVFATGRCFGCSSFFTFNPHKVPSVRHQGEREPICRQCVELVNPRRVANGLDPIEIKSGAYEAMPEREL